MLSEIVPEIRKTDSDDERFTLLCMLKIESRQDKQHQPVTHI